MTDPHVYTPQETADLLRIKVGTVRAMTRDGRLPKVRGLRSLRIPSRAVRQLQAMIARNDDGRAKRLTAAAEAMADCPMLPRHIGPGTCDGCGTALTGLQRRWCGSDCSDRWWSNHSWGFARPHAIVAAGGSGAPCARCGRVVGWRAEVNHVVPREGKGYGRGCHHHQSNLEVLCHGCHAIETTRQLHERRARRG